LLENFDYWKLYFSTMMQPDVFKLVKEKLPHFLPPLKVVEGYFLRKGINDPWLEAAFIDAVLDGIFLNFIMNPDGFPLEKIKLKIIERFK
jgi:hypothetical protein